MSPADLICAVHSKATNYIARGTNSPITGSSVDDANSMDLEGFVSVGYSHPAIERISPE